MIIIDYYESISNDVLYGIASLNGAPLNHKSVGNRKEKVIKNKMKIKKEN